MFYGGLFWNKVMRDSLAASFISLGWQTGLIRDAGGAVLSPLVQGYEKARGIAPDQATRITRLAENKSSYWAIYFGTFAFMVNAAMTKMFTGDNPEGMDYIFARIGGNNPDGTPRRITNMSYLREVPMWMKHVENQGGYGPHGIVAGTADMALNKTLIGPFAELLNNRDYYGNQLYDPFAHWWEQAGQLAQSEFRSQLNPITISGAQHAADLAGTWHDRAIPLSVLGFGPAPAYAQKTGTQNRIDYLYRLGNEKTTLYTERQERDAQMAARQAYKVAQQKNDPALMAEAQRALAEAHAKPPKNIPSDVFRFSKLTPAGQMAVLESASPDEAQKYLPHVRRDTSSRPEFMKWRQAATPPVSQGVRPMQ
jgi:hypothetical protein